MHVTVGDPAPEIALPDQDGNQWRLSDHRGSPVVVYFYPKADTPGCTSQACDVRDHWADLTAHGAAVAGISPDPVERLARFASKHGLPHRLLADPERTVIEAYGAWGEKRRGGEVRLGVIRSSVVIDAEGRVAAALPGISPAEQSSAALAVLRDL